MYIGLSIADRKLYLADFYGGKIDVLDEHYNRIKIKNMFVDVYVSDPIPLDYVPHNIVYIGDYLYVLYTRSDPMVLTCSIDDQGYGFISVFDFDGVFVKRFVSRGVLNLPWAMIPAPVSPGFPCGGFLVGNNGDGRIHIFDSNGKYIGPLLSKARLSMMTEKLRWLVLDHEYDEIYATSAPDSNIDGVVTSFVKDQYIQI